MQKRAASHLIVPLFVVFISLTAGNLCLAADGGGPPTPPKPITWVDFNHILTMSRPFLIVFDSGDAKEIARLDQKVTIPAEDASKIGFAKVVLTLGDVKQLNKLNKAAKPAAKDKEEDEEEPSSELNLALKYGIKSLPIAIGCDIYGNCLTTLPVADIKSSANIMKILKEISAKQKELEDNLPKDYEKVSKKYKAELEKKDFTKDVIKNLQAIARYQGYKDTKDAQANLDEINKVGSSELEQVKSETGAKDDAAAIGKLNAIAEKYKGLPVADEAAKVVQEIKEKAKSKPKEEPQKK